MAKDDKPKDEMGYQALQAEAMRGTIRLALRRAAGPRGLPGDHHFYISFLTGAPGVAIPAELRARYPLEMTIVLQNQFWDLKPGDSAFSVTLQFGGRPKSLSIPYAAVTRFYDPSVQYLLEFAPSPPSAPVAELNAPPPRFAPPPPPPPAKVETPKVVSLETFRKR
jgi:hypothetical protein